MQRREFLAWCAAGAAGVAASGPLGKPPALAGGAAPLRIAPRTGQFRHHAGDGVLDQIRFAADCGFSGFEDPALAARSRGEQQAIGRQLARFGLEPGTIAATADFRRAPFAAGNPADAERVLREVRRAIALARSIGGRTCGVMPGRAAPISPRSRQFGCAADLLRRCADIAETSGVTLVVEPLDLGPTGRRLLIRSLDEAAALCRQVGHPNCRAACDLYQVATEGGRLRTTSEVLAATDRAWDQIGSIRLADAPGRKEPGTGTLDVRAIVEWAGQRGYKGLATMDHGSARAGLAGERRVLDAYACHAVSATRRWKSSISTRLPTISGVRW